MSEVVDIFTVIKKNLPIFIGLSLCAYFSYHSIFGRYGYTHIQNLAPIAASKSKQLDALVLKSNNLESQVRLLRPDSLSLDALEEQIRVILGYSYGSEIVIID